MYLSELFLKPVSYEKAQHFLDTAMSMRAQAMMRDEMCGRYSFAIPCLEALDAIDRHGPILEIGAGSGLWASHLKDCIATDSMAGFGPNHYHEFFKGRYAEIHRYDGLEAVGRWPDRNVLMCWPNYDEGWACEVAETIPKGRFLIYIGEGRGGCTADDDFHVLLDSDFDVVEDVRIPQWNGMHDRLWIYEKATN